DGMYAIDGIPTGSYNVKATALNYRSDTRSVVVIDQSVSSVPDLELTPDQQTVILYGCIYNEDQITPFANKTIKLYRAGYNTSTGEYVPSTFVASTITSSKGEFAFMESSYDWYMLYYNSDYEIRWMDPDSPITGSTTNLGGIVERNAYIH
ncbi:MAG: carboxypeptidase-like regulatory domain-containing protein, partial [Bacteroidales bacterium]|nr:carboxypeptidase-like regulatory domain-containing protein [Bacteroidales bacterium]